ncbi:unnamed protein product [Microthlaspi erraticum]|uniref:Uncharacterized protein n=1 Tax=Microthlaspi erraticum TaxID=1685480 RepID=A0A6D2JWD3_9BRAS|nr:unnamed protein product [Microthlaspi erraticum]
MPDFTHVIFYSLTCWRNLREHLGRSGANFLDLASWDLLDFPQTQRALPRVLTVPGIVSELEGGAVDGSSDVNSSSGSHERKIIVANIIFTSETTCEPNYAPCRMHIV